MSIHEQDRRDQEYIDAMECAIHWQDAARKNPRQKNILAALNATDAYHALAERQGVPTKNRTVFTSEQFAESLAEGYIP